MAKGMFSQGWSLILTVKMREFKSASSPVVLVDIGQIAGPTM